MGLAIAAFAGGGWTDTACLATNVRNFPRERGIVVGASLGSYTMRIDVEAAASRDTCSWTTVSPGQWTTTLAAEMPESLDANRKVAAALHTAVGTERHDSACKPVHVRCRHPEVADGPQRLRVHDRLRRSLQTPWCAGVPLSAVNPTFRQV